METSTTTRPLWVSGAVAAAMALGSAASISNAQITLFQVDDFEDGTNAGWFEGGPSPNQPSVVPSGSFDGSAYLENYASGINGAGGRQVMGNVLNQWSGDYEAAGVTSIGMWARNDPSSAADLELSLYMFSIASGMVIEIGSSQSQTVAADGEWRWFEFDLTGSGMSVISGGGTVEDALRGVFEVRILSASNGPTNMGDQIESTLGVDNITALPAPAGVMIACGLGLVGARRRR